MIDMKTTVNITLDQWINEKVNVKLPAVVKKHAFNIAAVSASNAPVKTGFLKNSLASGAEAVDERNWTISDATGEGGYGRAQELGYAPRNLPALHFLGNAAEKEADKFFDDVRDALK